MEPRLRLFLFTSSLLLAAMSASAAPLTLPWDVDVAAAPRTAQFSAYRGETVEFSARLRNGAWPFELPESATASLHVSTNGVDYWSWPASATTGGVVRATWLPYYDCGADAYRCFIRVADGGSNVMYRANFLLRMLGSPGEWPAGLPPPVRLIDFDEVAVTNAPWATPDDVSNIVDRAYIEGLGISGGGGINEETDPRFAAWARTNEVLSTAIAYADGVGRGLDISIRDAERGYRAYADEVVSNALEAAVADIRGNVNTMEDMVYRNMIAWDADTLARATNYVNEALEAGDYASSAEMSAVRRTAEDASRDSNLIYQLMVGSNVVAEVTNYNSTVRSPQLRLLQLENGEYKVVWTETNGLVRVADAATNHTDNAIADEVQRADAAYAPRAWSRTTSGLGSEAPSNTTWVSTPVTVIAGGYEYEKHVTSAGEVWVLCSNGLSLGGDTNAYFRISSGDGEPLFAVEKTDAQLIGVRAGAISVTSSGGANLVTIPLDVVSATEPVCLASDNLAGGQWSDLSESAPAWVPAYSMTGSAGGWTATITTTAPRAFFQFRVLQEGTAVIRNYVQQDLSSGIVVDGTRYYPHASGGTLTWTTTP